MVYWFLVSASVMGIDVLMESEVGVDKYWLGFLPKKPEIAA